MSRLRSPLSRGRIAGLLLLVAPLLADGAERVRFGGAVKGSVVTDEAFQLLSSVAGAVSDPIGRCSQTFDELRISLRASEDALHLDAEGVCLTWTPQGELLRIAFELVGIFTTPDRVHYVGTYRVLAGGSGRFEYRETREDLGAGDVVGIAGIVPGPVPGTLLFRFKHEFLGDLLLEP